MMWGRGDKFGEGTGFAGFLAIASVVAASPRRGEALGCGRIAYLSRTMI
jgi:hypothetical protein